MVPIAVAGCTCRDVTDESVATRCRRSDDPHAPLVDRMADGESAAIGALHSALSPVLYRVAFRLLSNRADAEELVSDVLMKAWRDSARFDGCRGTVTGWLTVMLKSRGRDALRSRRRRDGAYDRAVTMAVTDCSAIGLGHSVASDVASALELQELGGVVAHAMHRLPAAQRTAIEHVFFRGLSHTQASERLGIPLGTVKTRVRLGLRQMRVMLGHSDVAPAA